VGTLLVGVAGGLGWLRTAPVRAPQGPWITHTVRYEPLRATIIERGTLDSAETIDIISRVRNRSRGHTIDTTIKWVIPDGTLVQRGDLLVELDDSGWREQLELREGPLILARAEWLLAEEDYQIAVSQSQGELRLAEDALRLAELELHKYLHGDYEQTASDLLGRITMALSDLELWRDRVPWTERMVRKGFLSPTQAKTEQARLKGAQVALDHLNEEQRVLLEHTKKQMQAERENQVAEARRTVERLRTQGTARVEQADISRRSTKAVYLKQKKRYEEIEEEIRKCTLTAPQDGLVVYCTPERFGGSFQQATVAQGEPVYEGQRLMCLPNLDKMQVLTRVPEAVVAQVRGEQWAHTGYEDYVQAGLLLVPDALGRVINQHARTVLRDRLRDHGYRQVYGGQPALIRLDAFPGRVLRGHVKRVATLPSQYEWMMADIKVYPTVVAIDEPGEGLRPGMGAEVTIVAADAPAPVLTVPVEAVVGPAARGSQGKCFVLTPQGPEERVVTVGLCDGKLAEIQDGLCEGEEVILNTRTLLNDAAKD
jgi:multidrug efflux pump subunit AcrA (membrane-fusion protein)